MSFSRRAAGAVLVAAAAALAAASPSSAGLPSVASGHRPGPDALYAPPPSDVPQLENAAPWTAPPILISGASAYRDGEFVYQDFLLDDHGAAGVPEDDDPNGPGAFLFSPTDGTVTYPDDPVYANNAADLVELRVKPLADATAFRVTLNTLKDPARSAFTIAIGTSDAARAWPDGAGVSSPAQLFLTVHGATATLRDAASGAVRTPAPTVSVDVRRRQFDVRLPHAAFDPGRGKVRLAAGVGLWDTAKNRYLAPEADRSATAPGGAAPTGAALFNVAFRSDEPFPDAASQAGVTIADAAAGAKATGGWWREKSQAEALRLGDISRFSAEVDFGKLAARVDDDSQVPATGPMNRILASRYVFGQGVDHSKVCFDLAASFSAGPRCIGRQVGQLQPYALYVPRKPRPAGGYGMTLLLHSLSANYNQYATTKNQSQLGERGGGSLVATPGGRGPDGFYAGIAEADTFEVWADVARHYDVDPGWSAVSGYSMGGFGTFRLLARWPDLFARGFSVVGVPGTVAEQLASLRNTPLLTWAAVADELVNIQDTEEATQLLTDAGVRFIHHLHAPADHLTLATNDEYGPGAEFLGAHRVDLDPPHVTYVVDPDEDSAQADAVADHAYWVSDVAARDPKAAPGATIDARSEAFGVGDAPVLDVQQGAGTLDGGTRGPLPYQSRERAWGPAPAAPAADRLVVRAKNVARATIDTRRARLSCAPALDVQSDGPLDLRLTCPPAPAAASATRASCGKRVRLRVPRVRGSRVVRVTVVRRGRVVKRVRRHRVRRVTVRRPTRSAFTLNVRARTKDGRTVTVLRRFRACGR